MNSTPQPTQSIAAVRTDRGGCQACYWYNSGVNTCRIDAGSNPSTCKELAVSISQMSQQFGGRHG